VSSVPDTLGFPAGGSRPDQIEWGPVGSMPPGATAAVAGWTGGGARQGGTARRGRPPALPQVLHSQHLSHAQIAFSSIPQK
jgi:hypothetical protein